MKPAWDQLQLDSSLCGVHKLNSKPIVDRNGAWMQSAKFPYLARGGENISLDIPFYRIRISGWRESRGDRIDDQLAEWVNHAAVNCKRFVPTLCGWSAEETPAYMAS